MHVAHVSLASALGCLLRTLLLLQLATAASFVRRSDAGPSTAWTPLSTRAARSQHGLRPHAATDVPDAAAAAAAASAAAASGRVSAHRSDGPSNANAVASARDAASAARRRNATSSLPEWRRRRLRSSAGGRLPHLSSLEGEHVSTWPHVTTHRCAGKELTTRTCYFKDLVYDKLTETFVYHTATGEAPSDDEVRRLRFASGLKLRVNVSTAPFPSRAASCSYYSPAYLTRLYYPHSFGHLVRDAFTIMAGNLLDLDLGRRTFQFLVYSSAHDLTVGSHFGYNVENELHVVRKYGAWQSTGVALLSRVSRLVAPQVCDRFVVFRSVVLSSTLFRLSPPFLPGYVVARRWGGCRSAVFHSIRSKAYELAGLRPTAASTHTRIRVLFGDKAESDNRRISNLAELLPALRRRFPEMDFDAQVLAHLTAEEQLQVLSRTSIFISPQGSSSFRLMFLPTDAHAIIVGPLEGANMGRSPFSEIDACFTQLSYVSIDRYHSTDASECEVRYQRRDGRRSARYYEFMRWWDSDRRLQVDKLAGLIEGAVAAIRRTRRGAVRGRWGA